MKHIKSILIFALGAIFFTGVAYGAPTTIFQRNILPEADQTYDLGSTTPALQWKNLYVKNITVSGTCTGCGGSSGTVSTSTNETQGFLPYWTTTSGTPAKLGQVATTTLTGTAPITFSQPISVIGSSASVITCAVASGSLAGCLSSTDWTTFNSKQASGFQISTTTVPTFALGNLAYLTGTTPTSIGGIATTTASLGTGLSYSGTLGSLVGGASGTLSLSGILPSSISLTKGNFLVGNDAGVAQATSTIFISSTGSIGIGTTTPTAKFSIKGTGATTGRLLAFSDSSDVEKLTILDNGNFGIGTTTPETGLVIRNGSAMTTNPHSLSFRIGVPAAASSAGVGIGGYTGGYGAIQGLSFVTTTAGQLLINPLGGSVGVGTFGAGSPANSLSVGGRSSVGATYYNITAPTNGLIVEGNSGIGTSTPTGLFNIAATANARLTLTDTDATANSKHFFIESNADKFSIGTTTDALVTSTTRALTVLATGFVGIGQATPSAMLTVGGTQVGNAGLEIVPGSGIVAQAYNRTSSAYASLTFDGSAMAFRTSGTSGNLHTFRQLTTTLAGATVGGNFDFTTSVTNASNNFTGIQLTTVAVTAGASNTLKGVYINPGAVTNASGATTYTGLDIQMPAITQTAGTLISTGLKITGGTVTSGTSYSLITDSTAGNVGIASSTPSNLFSVGSALNGFFVTTLGKIFGRDTGTGYEGVITPTRRHAFAVATSTATWTATSTPGRDISPERAIDYAGTMRTATCKLNTFLGVTVYINATKVTPTYFVASSTSGTITFTANNTFAKGDYIWAEAGTTTSATAASGVVRGSCTLGATETP